MDLGLEQMDKDRITRSILEKYAKASFTPEGAFKYPTGAAALRMLGYDEAVFGQLPATVQDAYCGVGNPFSLGAIEPGMTVLDIGSGAGVDTLVAALLVGPGGKAVGIDITPEMVARARANLELMKLTHVAFRTGSAEQLGFPSLGFDAVISNGALNLVVDKEKASAEIFRVLKPGGRLMVADQVLTGAPPRSTSDMVASWYR